MEKPYSKRLIFLNDIMKICTAIAALLAISSTSHAFEIDKESKSTEIGAASVIETDDQTYAVVEIPLVAPMVKSSTTKPPEADGTRVSPGCKMTEDEAMKVLELWFRRYSIDFESIKLRNTHVGDRQYVIWCHNPLFFICSDWQIRAGTWVEYEVNGKNRMGGMTGYQREIKAIRKSPKNGICAGE